MLSTFLSIFASENKFFHAMSTSVIQQKIADYFKTQPVLKAWLFGSYARGEETETSDVDILFVPDMSTPFGLFTLGGMYVDLLVKFNRSFPIGLFAYVRMHRELEERQGCKVDFVEEGTLRPAAQRTANRDLKVIYERSH